MRSFIKLISLLLVFLMLSSVLVACNNPDKSNDGKDNVANTIQGGAGNSKLPEIDWEGREYRILGRQYTEEIFTNFEVDRDEMPEDVVGLAVWNRNATLLAKYGIDVVGNLVDKPADQAKTFLEAGDDLYDLFMCPNIYMQQFGMSGHLININGLEYIDFENDCWNDYANEQLTFGGKLYYTTTE